jgi:hypothetical protein
LSWYGISIVNINEKFFRNNGLSLIFLLLFVLALAGQFFTGYKVHNKERSEEGQSPLTLSSYFRSGHFIQATFENWESEFLQMALFIILTISLRQKVLRNQKNCKVMKK